MPKQRSWSEEQLRAAVAASTSYRAVARALGLRDGSVRDLKETARELGIDTSHFTSIPKRLCSADQLRTVVAVAKSCTDVLRALGLELHSNNFVRLRRDLRAFGVDASHFLRKRNVGGRTRWTDDDLRAAVAASFGYAEVIRRLGLIPAGGNYVHIQKRIRGLQLDVSHFRGRGWNVEGKHIKPSALPLEEVLVANRSTTSHHLKVRLVRAGLKTAACERCGWAEQRPCDGVIPVELDHINGDKTDNRLENLRILCPNCHALQATHRGLNRASRRS